ncbi:MAG: zinc-dependent peptidase [Bacteroidia bacterium]
MIPLFTVLLFGFGESPLGFIIAAGLLFMLAVMLVSALRTGAKAISEQQAKNGHTDYGADARFAINYQLADFSYFRKLSQNGKQEFIRRILNFIETHTIDGIGNYNPELNEKIHVAAAATQLTFGLNDFAFTHFETIILYPGIFRMQEGGPLMKGATTPNGEIRISIRDFKEGYANPTDKLNVGLHEFGHALFMEFLKKSNEDNEKKLKNKMHPYLQTSDKMLYEGKHNDTFLRAYAFKNRHEFFAVSVEHFFEAPKEFKEKLPELYVLIKDLLQQDPASDKMDYGIVRNYQVV